jgi:hypothetical protein
VNESPDVIIGLPWFVRKGYVAITLPPFGIYITEGRHYDEGVRAHELIHWEQYLRHGALVYYLRYGWLWLRYGYENHPMEIEARERSGSR